MCIGFKYFCTKNKLSFNSIFHNFFFFLIQEVGVRRRADRASYYLSAGSLPKGPQWLG